MKVVMKKRVLVFLSLGLLCVATLDLLGGDFAALEELKTGQDGDASKPGADPYDSDRGYESDPQEEGAERAALAREGGGTAPASPAQGGVDADVNIPGQPTPAPATAGAVEGGTSLALDQVKRTTPGQISGMSGGEMLDFTGKITNEIVLSAEQREALKKRMQTLATESQGESKVALEKAAKSNDVTTWNEALNEVQRKEEAAQKAREQALAPQDPGFGFSEPEVPDISADSIKKKLKETRNKAAKKINSAVDTIEQSSMSDEAKQRALKSINDVLEKNPKAPYDTVITEVVSDERGHFLKANPVSDVDVDNITTVLTLATGDKGKIKVITEASENMKAVFEKESPGLLDIQSKVELDKKLGGDQLEAQQISQKAFNNAAKKEIAVYEKQFADFKKEQGTELQATQQRIEEIDKRITELGGDGKKWKWLRGREREEFDKLSGERSNLWVKERKLKSAFEQKVRSYEQANDPRMNKNRFMSGADIDPGFRRKYVLGNSLEEVIKTVRKKVKV